MGAKEVADRLLSDRSTIIGAMAWMLALAMAGMFVTGPLLGWIPGVGRLIIAIKGGWIQLLGPIVGGYIGGRRAGSVGRAAAAAMLCAALISLLSVGLLAITAALRNHPMSAVGEAIPELVGFQLIFIVPLFVSALVGGWTRQARST